MDQCSDMQVPRAPVDSTVAVAVMKVRRKCLDLSLVTHAHGSSLLLRITMEGTRSPKVKGNRSQCCSLHYCQKQGPSQQHPEEQKKPSRVKLLAHPAMCPRIGPWAG